MSDKVEVQDKRQHPFYLIYNEVIELFGPKIGAYGLAVYNVLVYYANERQEAWPSYQAIADQLGISRRKVVSTIDLLVAVGLIDRQQRKSPSGDLTSNVYTLLRIKRGGSAQDALPSAPRATPSAQDARRVVHRMHDGSAPRAQEQDPMNKIQSEQDPKTDDDDNARACETTDEVLQSWRDNIDGSMTPILVGKLKALIDEYGAPAVLHGITAAVEAGTRNVRYVATCAKNFAAGNDRPPPKPYRNGRYNNGRDRPDEEDDTAEARRRRYIPDEYRDIILG